MTCSKCNKRNSENSKFCVYCGNSLEPSIEQPDISNSSLGSQINPTNDINERIEQLSLKIELILDTLSKQGILDHPIVNRKPEIDAEPEPQLKETESEEIPVSSIQNPICESCGIQNESDSKFCIQCGDELQKQAVIPSNIPDLPIAIPTIDNQVSSTELTETTDSKTPVQQSKSFRLDSILGGNWLAGIGIISIIIGVIFLALLSDTLLKLVLTFLPPILVVAFLVLSQFWKTKYPRFAQVLGGGAIGILYAYSWRFWDTPIIPIFITLITSVLAAILALRHNSSYIAILGIIGAYLTPNILSAQKINLGIDIGIIIYLIAVNISVIILATFKTWRWFTLLALIGTLITYYSWYNQIGSDLQIIESQLSLTALFLIFVASTTLFHLIWKKASNGFDYLLMAINALGYLSLSYLIMYDNLSNWMGLFTLSVALLYLAISIISYFRVPHHPHLTLMSIGLTTTLVTTAIAVQFGDQHHWRTVFWSVHAAVLMLLAAKLSMKPLKFVSLIILGLTVVSIIADSFEAFTIDYRDRLNPYLASYLLTAVAFYAAAFISHKTIKTENLSTISSVLPRIIDKYTTQIFLASANIVTTIATAVLLEDPWISFGFAIKAAVLVFLGEKFKLNNLRWLSIPSLILSVSWILIFDIQNANSVPLMDALNKHLLPYILTLLSILITAYYIYKNRIENSLAHQIMLPLYLYSGIALSIIAPLVFDEYAWRITIIWAIQSYILIFAARKFALKEFEVSNLILLVLLTGKLLIIDSSVENFTPILNYRILSFMVGILTIYISAYVFKKWDFENPITIKFTDDNAIYFYKKHIVIGLITMANVLTFWILSSEVIETMDYFFHDIEDLNNIKSLSLSLVWAIYATSIISAGIILRLAKLRLVGIGIMALPIIKLYIYDLWNLENEYRVALFLILGLILLASGFLYQKYNERVKEFLSSDIDNPQ